jgi:hypothetical protein
MDGHFIANCLRKHQGKCHATTNDDNDESYGAIFATRADICDNHSSVNIYLKTEIMYWQSTVGLDVDIRI